MLTITSRFIDNHIKYKEKNVSQAANRVIKNTGYLYAKMAITMFVSLYTTRLILNSLGASDFGIYNIVGGAIAMLGFLNVAMASATQRFMSFSEGEGNKEKQKYIFNISCVLHLSISIIIGLVLLVAGWFFFHGILNIPEERISAAQVVYGGLIISTMLTVMNVPYDAVMNAHENMRYYAIVGVIESLLKLLVAFACVYTRGDKLIVYGLLMASIPLITLSIMKVYCHRHYEECVISPRRYYDKKLMREMTSFAGWSLAGSMGGILGNYGNSIVLNSFFGTILNAALGIANQLNGMLMVFSNSMLKALAPVIVKTEGGGEHDKMLEYSFTGCKFSFLLFAFFCLPCFVETPYVLKLWLKEYPEWTVVFVRFQIVRTIMEQTYITLGTSLNATGKIKQTNLFSFVLNLLPLLLLSVAFWLGASPWWYYPIIIFCMVVLTSSSIIYYCRKFCHLNVWGYFKAIPIPCFLVSASVVGVGFGVTQFMSLGMVRLLVNGALMSSALLLGAYWLLSVKERSLLTNVVRKLYNKVL